MARTVDPYHLSAAPISVTRRAKFSRSAVLDPSKPNCRQSSMTESMKVLRFAGSAAIGEKFLEPAVHPPTEIMGWKLGLRFLRPVKRLKASRPQQSGSSSQSSEERSSQGSHDLTFHVSLLRSAKP